MQMFGLLTQNLVSKDAKEHVEINHTFTDRFPLLLFLIGNEQRLTWVHTNAPSLANNALSAGIPSYVIQEEFCRFQGFWWQPVMSGMLNCP